MDKYEPQEHDKARFPAGSRVYVMSPLQEVLTALSITRRHLPEDSRVLPDVDAVLERYGKVFNYGID